MKSQEGIGDFRFSTATVEDLSRDVRFFSTRMVEVMNQLLGHTGTPQFFSAVNLQGHRVMKGGTPKADDDLQLYGLCLSHQGGDSAFDAKNKPVNHVAKALEQHQAVNLGQVQQLLGQNGAGNDATVAPPNISSLSAIGTFDGRAARQSHTHGVDSSTFTGTATGFGVNPTGTCKYVLVGKMVVLFLPTFSAVSNAATFTITGVPAAIQPILTSVHVVLIEDNTVQAFGRLEITASGTITLYPNATGAAGSWTAAGTKSLFGTTITYLLT